MPRQIDLFPQNLQVNNDPTNRLGVTAAQINHLNDQIPAALAKAQSLAITNFLTLLDQETGLDLLGWWKDTQDLLNFINAATQQSWMNFQNLVNSIAGGIDKDITDLIAALNSTSGDAATATANWDTLFLDLGFSVTTAAQLASWLGGVHTTAGNGTAWSTRLTNDLLITSDVFHLVYNAGTPTDAPGTLGVGGVGAGKPTWYSAWNDLLSLAGVVNSVSAPTDPAPAVAAAVTSAQSTANTATTNSQNLADAAHQAVYGGTATGTPTDIATLKNTQTSIPSENVVPVQNPNSSGMVAHGATGSGSSTVTAGNSPTITWPHTAAAADNYCVVPILYYANTTALGSINRSVTYGSAPMSSLGVVSVSSGVWLELFGLFGVPAGAQTVTTTVASINTVYTVAGYSTSYSGVGRVGGTPTNAGAAANPSQTVASSTGNMVVQAFGVSSTNVITVGSYNQTQRYNSGTLHPPLGSAILVLDSGDATGASSVSFTATASTTSGDSFAGMAVQLLPAAAVIGSGIRKHRASATTVAGSAGGPNLFALGFFDTTDLVTPDMSNSGNAVTVTQAGWYHVAIRSLITAAASTGMMTFSAVLYRNGSVDHILSGNSVAFNIVGAQDYTSNICGTGLVYCNAGDVLAPGYYQDGLGTFSSLTFFGESTGVQTHWSVTLANRSLL